MTSPFHRCVVVATVEGEDYEFFVYGVTAEELLTTREGGVSLGRMLRRRFGATPYLATVRDHYDPDMPQRTVPIVYSKGRRAPEFI